MKKLRNRSVLVSLVTMILASLVITGCRSGSRRSDNLRTVNRKLSEKLAELNHENLRLRAGYVEMVTTTASTGASTGKWLPSRYFKRLRRRGGPAQPWETTGMSEELWIVEKWTPADVPAAEAVDRPPTQGELRAKLPDKEKEIPLPLTHTDVKARVSAFIATVDVTQKYHNPYDTKIEAVYVFPLPQSSAVTEFVMTIGTRRIRAIIREREEAEKIYEEAKRQGKVASLLTQERPNIFTQKVANIEPGKKIDIQITYFSPLRYTNGEYEFVFPTVVGPRFNPPGSTDGVGAVARGRGRTSGQKTEIQYMKPNERSGHDITIYGPAGR